MVVADVLLALLRPARAEPSPPMVLRGWSASALAGYSAAKSDLSYATNTYSAGVGLRAGYTFKLPIYVGLTYVRHFGVPTPGFSDAEARGNVAYFGAEAGYEIRVARFLLRPYLGFGPQVHYETVYEPHANVSVSETAGDYFTFWPGVTALIAVGALRAGIDVRYTVETVGVLAHGPAVYATWGLHFD